MSLPAVFSRRRLAPLALPVLGLAAALAALPAGPALAGCTDPPAPGVNWQRCNFDGLDLSQVELAGARLRDGSYFRTNLEGADLSGIEGYRAKFINAQMAGADLSGADLERVDFTKADLADASFEGADLRNARLTRANLRGANLTGAQTGGADFFRADLSGATWIDGERICKDGSIGRCN